MSKKPVLTLQLVVGIIVLVCSVGSILVSVSQTKSLISGGATIEVTEEVDIKAEIESAMSNAVMAFLFGSAALFGSLFALISLFMVLDSIYKWPSRKLR